MYKSMFRPEVIIRDELCFFRPCKTSILASDVRNPPRCFPCSTLNFCLYKPCARCLSGLHFQPCFVSEPNCNRCLSNKYTYMQLRSPEVTRVNFHLSPRVSNVFSRGSIAKLKSNGDRGHPCFTPTFILIFPDVSPHTSSLVAPFLWELLCNHI